MKIREDNLFKPLNTKLFQRKFTSIRQLVWFQNSGDINGLLKCHNIEFGGDK